MANASAKKTAANNERAISNLRQGLLITITLSMLIRFIFRLKSLSPAKLSFWTQIISHILSTMVARYLSRIGEPKRSATGELISPGEDLNQPGVIEWCFDIIYVSCKCAANLLGSIFQTVFCRGVPSRECTIRRKVLVVSRSRKPCPRFPILPEFKPQQMQCRSHYMRFTRFGHRSSGHTLGLGSPLFHRMTKKTTLLNKRVNGRKNSRSAAREETLVSKRRPSKSSSEYQCNPHNT